MDEFWKKSPKKVAQDLSGKVVKHGKIRAVIKKAQGFSRKENQAGIYEPLLEMEPGGIYLPWNRAILFLIATHDRGAPGGCVLIREIEIKGVLYKGPQKVAEQLHINKTHLWMKGATRWLDDTTFEILIGTETQKH